MVSCIWGWCVYTPRYFDKHALSVQQYTSQWGSEFFIISQSVAWNELNYYLTLDKIVLVSTKLVCFHIGSFKYFLQIKSLERSCQFLESKFIVMFWYTGSKHGAIMWFLIKYVLIWRSTLCIDTYVDAVCCKRITIIGADHTYTPNNTGLVPSTVQLVITRWASHSGSCSKNVPGRNLLII